MTITHKIRGRVGIVLAVLAASVTLLGVVASKASAYEGIFCYNINIAQGHSCTSNYATNIRRAIGNSPGHYTQVTVSTQYGEKNGYCFTTGCTANTGYLSQDGNGYGGIWNEGPSGTGTYYGYLYP